MSEDEKKNTGRQPHRPVRALSADVARKIAAGEVIDRPAAIVRELLDNAVDSGADRISVDIAGGGIDRIRVTDNGGGMTKEDLAACARPHATSKIVSAEDLLALNTLGFRGEALASIAAVARLSIASGCWRMKASITEDHLIEAVPPVQNGQGTIVMSEGLFENFPARRRFLKRASSETLICRELFIEKALPRTDISFRLTVDGTVRSDLPAGVSLAERFTRALELKEAPALFYELKAHSADWSFTLVIGEPGIRRNDRKQLFIYVNGRRVTEYSLLQAIEYGCQGFFPNGTHPVGALFVTINPALVDFNIHPAKREVRFKDSAELHHGVSSTVGDFFRAYGIRQSRHDGPDRQLELSEASRSALTGDKNQEEAAYTGESPLARNSRLAALAETALAEPSPEAAGKPASASNPSSPAADLRARFFDYERNPAPAFHIRHGSRGQGAFIADVMEEARAKGDDGALLQATSSPGEAAAHGSAGTSAGLWAAGTASFKPNYTDCPDADGFRFIGSALGTFLLAEVGDSLYFIDQHAAHERIIFDQLTGGDCEKQELLIPYVLTTESDEEDQYLKLIQEDLAKIGFTARPVKDGRWEFSTIPARWNGTEEELREILLEKRADSDKVMYNIAAMTACKAAVKDGFVLDAATASDLAKKALALPDPHCPHGRPVWTSLSREQLFARVRRTE